MNRIIVVRKSAFVKTLDRILLLSDMADVRENIRLLRKRILASSHPGSLARSTDYIVTSRKYIAGELEQIQRSQTVERAVYYVSRLRKAFTTEKKGTVNDINLRRWKEYSKIWTDSLWMIPRRDGSAGHSGWYWGNFVPQIPHQLMLRYTRKGEWVLDPFVGSGTTLLECIRLGRNGIGFDLNETVAKKTKSVLKKTRKTEQEVKIEVEIADSTRADFRKPLKSHGAQSVQLVILHPPYHDIIRFSQKRGDLSNAASTGRFLHLLGKVVDNSLKVLDNGRFLALVIGDKYSKREWVPLGFLAMHEVLKRKCRLKSIVVKNFDQTTGKRKQGALWRYRALAGGFYIFKHEYVFIFQKS